MMPSNSREMERERARGHGWGAVRAERWGAVLEYAKTPVLDVGCSSGEYVNALVRNGMRAVGVDMLSHSEWNGPRSMFVRGDAAHLPFPDRAFSTVLAFETLEHLRDPGVALREWCRVCSGTLILSVPNAQSPYWSKSARLDFRHYADRTHVNFFDEDGLSTLMQNTGLAVVEVRPILPINPFIPALDALGLAPAFVERVGRRLGRLQRRTIHSGLLAVGRKQ